MYTDLCRHRVAGWCVTNTGGERTSNISIYYHRGITYSCRTFSRSREHSDLTAQVCG